MSSSYVFDQKGYLGYCTEELQQFLPEGSSLLFVPFAYRQHDEYTQFVQQVFKKIGVRVTGAHTVSIGDAHSITDQYDAVFCGGGNTFLLLAELYNRNLVSLIREAVAMGLKYMGSSSGAIVACPTIGTTNDMAIVEPTSLKALALIPFCINPHYYERPEMIKHMGESRRDRIHEFLMHNDVDVLAMREGAILLAKADKAELVGKNGGIVFQLDSPGQALRERQIGSGERVSFLLGQAQR